MGFGLSFVWRMTAVAPTTSKRRKYLSPCLEMPPSPVLPPVECVAVSARARRRTAARAELIGIGDGGGKSRGRDHAEARESGKPATGLALGMPGHELPIQFRDLIVERHDLANKNPQSR